MIGKKRIRRLCSKCSSPFSYLPHKDPKKHRHVCYKCNPKPESTFRPPNESTDPKIIIPEHISTEEPA